MIRSVLRMVAIAVSSHHRRWFTAIMADGPAAAEAKTYRYGRIRVGSLLIESQTAIQSRA
jgi:hypothetical protein